LYTSQGFKSAFIKSLWFGGCVFYLGMLYGNSAGFYNHKNKIAEALAIKFDFNSTTLCSNLKGSDGTKFLPIGNGKLLVYRESPRGNRSLSVHSCTYP
ncbi:hypothetical protein ACS8YF_18500, partial [Salinisphaera sp. SWV1]|uniref:hypothetical protein n=1 Tax=Salinisphaera sp. SWV1 TaxID=3454139 RepID=UPI003F85CF96